jgi:hypothetical protein
MRYNSTVRRISIHLKFNVKPRNVNLDGTSSPDISLFSCNNLIRLALSFRKRNDLHHVTAPPTNVREIGAEASKKCAVL